MDNLLDVLFDFDESIAWDKEEALVDDQVLDSFGIISLVTELEDAFDIEIETIDMIPKNLNSAEAMWNMIQRLQER